ncbi:DinB family protein [Actinocorallia lasiicapitis]
MSITPEPGIVPDTKNWTWVTERECPECRFDASSIALTELPELLTGNAAEWHALLTSEGPHDVRPEPGKWSPLEYAAHVRDCIRIYDFRLGLMLTQDDPAYPNWDQDETAVTEKYNEQDPRTVAAEIVAAAEALAAKFAAVQGEQWKRTGRRSDGASFTVETFGRYFIHDPIHHWVDVSG